ncbi:MAG: DUF4149 domain-containing protein, partial [Candidatus Methylomirabilales bacterium]
MRPIFLAGGTGAWLGAMVFLSFVVAPTAFATLTSRHQAGDLVAATLNTLYLSGYILGPLLVLVSVVTQSLRGRLLWAVRTILLVLMTVSTVLAREFVGAKLLSLRRAMGPMINVPPDDPMRLLFQQWHQVSVLLMLFNIAAA